MFFLLILIDIGRWNEKRYVWSALENYAYLSNCKNINEKTEGRAEQQ